MAKANIGELNVVIGGQSKLDGLLKRTGSQLAAFNKKVSAIGSRAGTAGLAAAAAGVALFANEVRQSFSELDDLAARSQKLAVAPELLQQLDYAAKLSNVSAEQLSGTFLKLQKNLSLASTGSKVQAEAFEALGLEVSKLKEMKPELAFLATIDALNKVENNADNLRLSMEIMGKSAADLRPLFAEGAEGIAKLMAEREAMGTQSEADLENLLKANDAWDKMGASIKAAADQIAVGLSPAIESLSETITQNVQRIRQLYNLPNEAEAIAKRQAEIQGGNDVTKGEIPFSNAAENVLLQGKSYDMQRMDENAAAPPGEKKIDWVEYLFGDPYGNIEARAKERRMLAQRLSDGDREEVAKVEKARAEYAAREADAYKRAAEAKDAWQKQMALGDIANLPAYKEDLLDLEHRVGADKIKAVQNERELKALEAEGERIEAERERLKPKAEAPVGAWLQPVNTATNFNAADVAAQSRQQQAAGWAAIGEAAGDLTRMIPLGVREGFADVVEDPASILGMLPAAAAGAATAMETAVDAIGTVATTPDTSALDDARSEADAIRMMVRTPAETYAEEMLRATDLLHDGLLSQEEFNRHAKALAEDRDNALGETNKAQAIDVRSAEFLRQRYNVDKDKDVAKKTLKESEKHTTSLDSIERNLRNTQVVSIPVA